MDWNEIDLLLRVAQEAQKYPNLKPILVEAMAQLEKIANPPKAEPTPSRRLFSSTPAPAPTTVAPRSTPNV